MTVVTTTWYSQACDPRGCETPEVTDITETIVWDCSGTGTGDGAYIETDCEPVSEEIPIIDPQNLSFLCSDIEFRNVGYGGYTAEILNFGLSATNWATGYTVTAVFPTACITIPTNSALSASLYIDDAYGMAATQIYKNLARNKYGSKPISTVVRTDFQKEIVKWIAYYAGKSTYQVKFSGGPCLGDVPITKAKYCK